MAQSGYCRVCLSYTCKQWHHCWWLCLQCSSRVHLNNNIVVSIPASNTNCTICWPLTAYLADRSKEKVMINGLDDIFLLTLTPGSSQWYGRKQLRYCVLRGFCTNNLKTISAISLWQVWSDTSNISDPVLEIKSILAFEHCVKCVSCIFLASSLVSPSFFSCNIEKLGEAFIILWT